MVSLLSPDSSSSDFVMDAMLEGGPVCDTLPGGGRGRPDENICFFLS